MLVCSKSLCCFYCLQLFNFFRETSPVPPRSRTPSPAKEVSPPTTSSGNSPVLGSIPFLFLHPPCFIDADCLVCLFSTGLTMMGVWHWGASCKFYSNNKGKKKIDDRETGTENKFPWQLPFVMVVKQSMNVVHLLIANTKEQKKDQIDRNVMLKKWVMRSCVCNGLFVYRCHFKHRCFESGFIQEPSHTGRGHEQLSGWPPRPFLVQFELRLRTRETTDQFNTHS